MVKTYVPPDSREVICPSCGAGINAQASPRSRRVQCPHCREVVVLENHTGTETPTPERTGAAPAATGEHGRIAALEARVAALEAAMNAVPAAHPGEARDPERKKLLWIAGAADPAHEFSPERGRALAHNLGTVRPREIIIRTPAGDLIAGERAAWFKAVFEQAGWTVRGPEHIVASAADAALTLAVPELPVAKEAAETYLALKAAGFEPVPVLDSTLANSGEAASLSLTLPQQKAA
jgi:hypothetical protein